MQEYELWKGRERRKEKIRSNMKIKICFEPSLPLPHHHTLKQLSTWTAILHHLTLTTPWGPARPSHAIPPPPPSPTSHGSKKQASRASPVTHLPHRLIEPCCHAPHTSFLHLIPTLVLSPTLAIGLLFLRPFLWASGLPMTHHTLVFCTCLAVTLI